MIPNTEQVLAAALKLSREERTAVVDELLRSLDDVEDPSPPMIGICFMPPLPARTNNSAPGGGFPQR